MTDSVSSSGDKGGIQPQVVQSNGIDNLVQSELRLNLKLSTVLVPNQEGEQQPGQTIHYTVQHGTCQLILPRQLASDLLLNLKIPETLSLNFGQSSAPEPQMSTVQQPEALQGNLPLTNLLLDIMKQSKQAIDETKIILQNRSDRFVKVEEDLAKLKIAFFSSIGLKDDDNRDFDNVSQKPIPIPNMLSVDVPNLQQLPTIIEPKTEILSNDSTTTSTKPGLLFPSKHHPLFSPFSGENKIEDKDETVLVPSSAVDLPEATSKTDETAESEDPAPTPYRGQIRSDPQPSTSQGTSANPHGVDGDDRSVFSFPSPRLAETDREELGRINVMLRKIVILLRDMEDNREIGTQRPYSGEHLNNLYKLTQTGVFKKSMFQKKAIYEFLEKRVEKFKKTNPLYSFYQAQLELFRWYDENRIHEISCYLVSKKDEIKNLKIVEQNIIPELNKMVEKRFNDRINKYIEVQGRRYNGEAPQEGDETYPDWRTSESVRNAYEYILDSPSYTKQELFRSAKKRHEENAWQSEKEGFYNLFYSFLWKNPKNKQMINSDFAFFANYEYCFNLLEQRYFSSILKIWDRTTSK